MSAAGYTPISLYHSTTASAVPTAGNLAPGELGLNIADMKLYCENSSGVVTLLASAGGASGDVVGPASSTDNAVVRFDGATGKLVQNSGVTIDDSGNMVISVNSATDALRITQTGAGNALVVEDSSNPDSSPFVVDASGNVGIGTTTPAAAFSVVDNDTLFYQEANVVAQYTFRSYASTVGNRAQINIDRYKGTYSSPTPVASGDTMGWLNFRGYDGSLALNGATIRALVTGAVSTNVLPTDLAFYTNGGASNVTERMRIDSAGRVGIGATPNASEQFRVSGTGLSNSTVRAGYATATFSSATTVAGFGWSTSLSTAAASFTLPVIYHFQATQGTFGAGSTVTDQYGFHVGSGLIGATNNYGFYSDIASGTGRWNFYANGTAENYLGGNLKIGSTAARGTTAGTNHLSIFNGTAPAGTLTNGVTLYSASGDLNFMDAAGNAFKVGYRNIPPVGTKTGSYTLAVGDVGEYVQVGSGGSITIPDATFAEGDVISIFNNTTGNITITCSITTAYIAGTDSDKATMTLATRGVATVLFISSTVCVVSGNVT